MKHQTDYFGNAKMVQLGDEIIYFSRQLDERLIFSKRRWPFCIYKHPTPTPNHEDLLVTVELAVKIRIKSSNNFVFKFSSKSIVNTVR